MILGLYRDSGKANGNYYIILGYTSLKGGHLGDYIGDCIMQGLGYSLNSVKGGIYRGYVGFI